MRDLGISGMQEAVVRNKRIFSAALSPGRLLYLARKYGRLGARYWHAERILTPRITHFQLQSGLPPADVPVHLLTSERDWMMALWMLASLHAASGRRWPIVIHEDGSMPGKAADLFRRLFENVRIISRGEADSHMLKPLARYPRCAEYRRRMPHGLKCFDVPQLASADRFLLLDPDVLFFAPPLELIQWADDPEDLACWFNEDAQEPAPIAPEEASSDLGIELWPRVNSGLCALNRRAINLDRMEQWLAHPKIAAGNAWRTEQTLLALSGSAWGRGGLLPRTYEVSLGRDRSADAVARHYVGAVRDRFYSEGVAELAGVLLEKLGEPSGKASAAKGKAS